MPPATTSAAALANLQNFTGSLTSPDAALQKEQQGLGVDAAQQQVTGLQGAITNTTNLLNRVAPSVMGRTAGSLVTSAQADRQIGNEQAPLNTQLNSEQDDYTKANASYADKQQQAEALANADMAAQGNQEGYLQNIYNSLASQEQNAAALAEQTREFNQTPHGSSGTGSPTLVGGIVGGQTQGFAPGSGYSMGTNSVGGLSFVGPGGKPVTAGQYVASGGGGVAQLAQVLAQSKDPGDQLILRDLNSGVPVATLQAKYPYIFGGI